MEDFLKAFLEISIEFLKDKTKILIILSILIIITFIVVLW